MQRTAGATPPGISRPMRVQRHFVAWLRASWSAWKVAIHAPAGGQWIILVRSWLTLDDRYSPYLLAR